MQGFRSENYTQKNCTFEPFFSLKKDVVCKKIWNGFVVDTSD